jgi:hypothetical protein
VGTSQNIGVNIKINTIALVQFKGAPIEVAGSKTENKLVIIIFS